MRRLLKRRPFGSTRLSKSAPTGVRQGGDIAGVGGQGGHPVRRKQQAVEQGVAEATGAPFSHVKSVFRRDVVGLGLNLVGDGQQCTVLDVRRQRGQLAAG